MEFVRNIRIAADFYRQTVPVNLWMIGLAFLAVWITRSEELLGLLCFMQIILLFFSLFAAVWTQRRRIFYYRNLGVSNGLLLTVAILYALAGLGLIVSAMSLANILFL